MLVENIELGNKNNINSSNDNIITKKTKKDIKKYNDWLSQSNAVNHLLSV